MIKTKMAFSEESIKTALRSKRFLFESAIDEVLPEKPAHLLIQELRGRILTPKKKHFVDVVWAYTPTEVVQFLGARKMALEWWGAVLKVENPSIKNQQEKYILLEGFSGPNGSTADIDEIYNILEDAEEDLYSNIESKVKKRFNLVFELSNMSVLEMTLPIMKELERISEQMEQEEFNKKTKKEEHPKEVSLPFKPIELQEDVVVDVEERTTSSGAISLGFDNAEDEIQKELREAQLKRKKLASW